MVDCGVSFAHEADPAQGIKKDDIICADPRFIADRRGDLAGIIITHAHEDHIGALPYLWQQFQCPVYTTPFTAHVLQRKLAEVNLLDAVPINIVDTDARIHIGDFDVEWITLTHSIPEPQALVIRTACGSIFHTADWKIDAHPQVGEAFNENKIKSLKKHNITAMVCDSTNATHAGHSLSEYEVYKGLLEVISQQKQRVIATCFGSNVARMQSLVKVANKTQRYAALLGRSLHNMKRSASACNYWPEDLKTIAPSHLGFLPREEVLAIATGSQGDEFSALDRLSQHMHRDVDLEAGDTVIFSSKTIPGNEKAIEKVVNRFTNAGINIINEENHSTPIHATGHPCEDELRDMYRWVQPRIAIPVHGEDKHIKANAIIANSEDIGTQMCGQNGDLFQIAPQVKIQRQFTQAGRIKITRPS